MSDSWSEEFKEALLSSGDYRSFLHTYATFDADGRKPPSLAQLARRAGFSSRSFIGDVIKARKRLTQKSLPMICEALQLSSLWKDFFILQVSAIEADLNSSQLTTSEIADRLEKIKDRLSGESVFDSHDKANYLYRIRHAVRVYAALGEREEGSSFTEIAKRLQVKPSELTNALNKMLSVGLIEQSPNEKYKARNMHLILEKIGRSPYFREYYLKEVENLGRAASQRIADQDQLFFHSSFSIDSNHLPELRTELLHLLHSFVDRNESAKGERVINLLLGLY